MPNYINLIQYAEQNQNDKFIEIIKKEIASGAKLIDWHLDKQFSNVIKTILNKKNVELMSFLLKNGFRSTYVQLVGDDHKYHSLLWLAVSNNDLEMTRLLSDKRYLQHEMLVLNSAVKKAIKTNNLLLVTTLLEQNEVWEVSLVKKAFELGHYEIMWALIQNGIHIQGLFNHSKREFEISFDKLFLSNRNQSASPQIFKDHEEAYRKKLQILLDQCIGQDFYDLDFLRHMDVAELNFVGISVQGVPITRTYLQSMQCKSIDKALIAPLDIENLSDQTRKAYLQQQLIKVKTQLKLPATLYSDDINKTNDAPINLVSLGTAVKFNNLDLVKTRLSNKVDPNELSMDYAGNLKHP